jgi:ribosomal protein S7
MPKGTKVARCVTKVMKTGKKKGIAIAICQKSTKMSYKTGKKIM